MKRCFKFLAVSSAIIFSLASCQRKVGVEVPSHSVTFDLYQEEESNDSKTSFDVDNGVVTYNWNESDANTDLFFVYENDGSADYTSGQGTVTSATLSNGLMTVNATFPGGSSPANPVYTAHFNKGVRYVQNGDNQSYDQKSDVLKAAPIVGGEGSSFSLSFKRLGAISKVTLKGLEGSYVGELVLTSDKPISGNYDFGEDGFDENASNEIRVSQIVEIENGNADIFFVSIPVVDATITAKVITLDEDMETYVKTYEKTLGRPITFNRGNVKYFGVSGLTEMAEPAFAFDLSHDCTKTASGTEMTWESAIVDMAAAKASATTATNNYYPGSVGKDYTSTRFYKNGTLSITPKTGVKIVKAVFDATTDGYATALNNSTWENATSEIDENNDKIVIVTPTKGKQTFTATLGNTVGFTTVTFYYENAVVETFTVTLSDDSSELVSTDGSEVVLPVRSAVGEYGFLGWSETDIASETTTAPEGVISAGNYVPRANVTLYPVYSRVSGSSSQTNSPSVTISDYATANSWQGNGAKAYTSVVIDENITASTTGTGNNGKYYTDWRFYQNGNGNVILTASNNAQLKSATFTFTVTNTGALYYGADKLTSGTAVNLSGTSATFTVGNSGSATNGQVKITQIAVTYSIVSGGTTSYYSHPRVLELIGIEASGTPAEFWLGDQFNTVGMTITATWDDESETDVTESCEFSGYNMSQAGQQTVTVTYQGETCQYNIDVKTIANTAETAYTAAEAIELYDNGKDLTTGVYVKGTVCYIQSSSVASDGTLNYFVSENGVNEGKTFEFYKNKKSSNSGWSNVSNISVGDYVVGYGTLTKYQSTYEFAANNYLVSHIKTATLSIADVTVPVNEEIHPQITTNIVGDYTISYTSEDDEIVIADGDELLANAVGSVEITATISAEGYKSATTTFTANVTNPAATLTGVVVEGTLTKTVYTVDESFDYAGLVAKAQYSDESEVDVTDQASWTISPKTLATAGNDIEVSVVATFNEVPSTPKVCHVTVNKKVSSISIADVASLEVGKTHTIVPSSVTPSDANITYAVTSGSAVSVSGNVLTGVSEGDATVTASFAGNDKYAECSTTFNVTVIPADTRLTASQTGFDSTSGSLDGYISYEAFKGDAGTAPGIYNNGIRLYQNGGYVTISGKTGVTISEVTITTTSTYSTTVGVATGANPTKPASGTNVSASGTFTASDLDCNSVSLFCLGTTSSTRLEIASIEVKYTKDSSVPTTYSVVVANNIEHGTVTASPTSAEAGTTITLTANPETGYEFGSWNVTNASTHAAITVTNNQFIMPDADVNVSATFNQTQGGGGAKKDVTATINFGTNNVKINAASATGNDDKSNSWTITTAGTSSFTQSGNYSQVGSSSKPATSITFTTTLPSDAEVTSISAKFGGFTGTAGTVTLKVGNNSVGTGSLNAANDVTVTSTSTASGNVITITVTGIAKGVKVYNIVTKYKSAN